LRSAASPHCFGGSGRQGESSYYKIDEALALMKVVDNVLIAASKAKTLGDIHPLIEHYDSVRFSRQVINRQLNLVRYPEIPIRFIPGVETPDAWTLSCRKSELSHTL
jgi:hypothetical protein